MRERGVGEREDFRERKEVHDGWGIQSERKETWGQAGETGKTRIMEDLFKHI